MQGDDVYISSLAAFSAPYFSAIGLKPEIKERAIRELSIHAGIKKAELISWLDQWEAEDLQINACK